MGITPQELELLMHEVEQEDPIDFADLPFDEHALRELVANHLCEMADAYLAGQSDQTPLASPVMANLEGLPPLLIQAGSEEILHDDATALHRAAINDGVRARLEVFPEMIHVFQMFHPVLDEGKKAIEHIAAFVEEHWTNARGRNR